MAGGQAAGSAGILSWRSGWGSAWGLTWGSCRGSLAPVARHLGSGAGGGGLGVSSRICGLGYLILEFGLGSHLGLQLRKLLFQIVFLLPGMQPG